MEIKSITIRRNNGYSDPKGAEYIGEATIEAPHYSTASIKVDLTKEQLAPIVQIMAAAVAGSLSKAADEFQQSVVASLNGPAIDAQITDQSADDKIPY